MIVGEGAYRYEVMADWEQLPAGWEHGDVAGLATDAQNRVYVFNRSEHPVIVYDQDGRFLDAWGDAQTYPRPHGITIVDDVIYLVDDGDHTVRKTTLDGKILMTLGTSGVPSDTGYRANVPGNLSTITHGAGPFNRPTRVSVAQNGELYVSDGYGNARVHRYSAEGDLLQSWGEPGTEPGQFNLPHSVWAHTDGRVFVCDRENDRVQVFGPTGELLTIWTNCTRPGDLYIDGDGTVYLGEMDWQAGTPWLWGGSMPENRPAQLSIRDLDGNILTRWGTAERCAPGSFVSPHGLWVDSQGSIYVGEVTRTSLSRFGSADPTCHTVQKFARI
jgi:sugar lactone lactonase YvrE